MSKDDLIPAEGTIIDKQPNAFFKVQLDNSAHVVLAARRSRTIPINSLLKELKKRRVTVKASLH